MKLPAHDKLDHAVYAAGIVALVWPLHSFIAIFVAILAVTAKEYLWDASGRGEKDPSDMLAGFIGIALAALWMGGAVPWLAEIF